MISFVRLLLDSCIPPNTTRTHLEKGKEGKERKGEKEEYLGIATSSVNHDISLECFSLDDSHIIQAQAPRATSKMMRKREEEEGDEEEEGGDKCLSNQQRES